MEKILKRKVIFKGRKIQVLEKHIDFGNGAKGIWEMMITHPGKGASILALDKKNYIYLVKQFKPSTDSRMITLPTGGIEKKRNSSANSKKRITRRNRFPRAQVEISF